MEILDREFSLHELAQSCTADKWIEYLDIAQLDEYAHVIKFQVNRRNELRYTPLHTAIFARLVRKEGSLKRLSTVNSCILEGFRYVWRRFMWLTHIFAVLDCCWSLVTPEYFELTSWLLHLLHILLKKHGGHKGIVKAGSWRGFEMLRNTCSASRLRDLSTSGRFWIRGRCFRLSPATSRHITEGLLL